MIRPLFYRTLAAPLAAAVLCLTTPTTAAATPIRILTLGDSITAGTAGGQWQTTLCQQIAANTNRACVLDNPSVGGTSCIYWVSRIQALLAAFQPDIVTLNCGTNEDVNATAYGEPQTTWAWRYTVEAIHNWNPATLIVPAFIQYSDPLIAPQWLLDSEPTTNDRIYSQFQYHRAWFPAIADMQVIPATADYLDSGGIHPTARGYRYYGITEYQAMRVGMGWPSSPDAALCGLYGHRRGYPRPVYTPCPN